MFRREGSAPNVSYVRTLLLQGATRLGTLKQSTNSSLTSSLLVATGGNGQLLRILLIALL